MIPNQCFPSWLSLSLPGVRREAMKIVITALLQLSLRHDPQAREHGQNSRPGSPFHIMQLGILPWTLHVAERWMPPCSSRCSAVFGRRLLQRW